MRLRRFLLKRSDDVSGTSGTGTVAEGVRFNNGYAALSWLTPLTSCAMYHSVDVLMAIHGHGGKTLLEWIDPE